jgi:hypothetical protein
LRVYDSNDVLVGPVIGFGGGLIVQGRVSDVGPYVLVKADGLLLPWIVRPQVLTLREPLALYFDGPGCTGNAFIAREDRRSQPKPFGYPYKGPGNTVYVELEDAQDREFTFDTIFTGGCIVNDGALIGVPAQMLSLDLDDYAPPFRIESGPAVVPLTLPPANKF